MNTILANIHQHFMNHALHQAHQAFDDGEVPIGAIVVMQNKIIAKAHNQTEKLKDPTAHAEMIALTSAFSYLNSKYLPEAMLYVTVEPCLMCAGAMYWSKIGTLVYGADDDKQGGISFCASQRKVLHPKTTIVKGVLQDDCTQILKKFFEQRRRVL